MSTQYDFLPGIDPSSLASITQAQLLQMISQIAPLSNIGGVIWMSGASSAHPSVVDNPRFVRYIWIDTQTTNSPVIRLYTGTYPSDVFNDWSAFAVPNNSITTAMLQALSVSIAKLSSVGGTNGQLLQVNAAGGYTFVDFSALLTSGIVPLTAINKSAASDGQVLQYKSADARIDWRTLDAGSFGAATIPVAKLANVGAYQFVTGDINGVISGLTFDTSAKVSNYFAALTIPLTRLEGTGTPATGDYLRWNGSNWSKWTPQVISADTVMAQNSAIIASTAHNLSAIPSVISAFFVARANNGGTGYTVGDIIPASSVVQTADGTVVQATPILTPWANTSNYGLNCGLDSANLEVLKRDGSGRIAVTRANFILDWTARIVLRA